MEFFHIKNYEENQKNKFSKSFWLNNSDEMISFNHLGCFDVVDLLNSCYRRIYLPDHYDIKKNDNEYKFNPKYLDISSPVVECCLYDSFGKIIIAFQSGLIRILDLNFNSLKNQLQELQIELKNEQSPTIIEENQPKDKSLNENSNTEFAKYPF